jgi:hypothetical protein
MDGNSIDNFIIYDEEYLLSDHLAEWNEGLGSISHNGKNRFVHLDFNTVGATAGGTNTGLTTATDQSGNGRDGTLTNFGLSGATSNYVTSVNN